MDSKTFGVGNGRLFFKKVKPGKREGVEMALLVGICKKKDRHRAQV